MSTTQKVADLGSILSIWAHPDDETFFCAGIMAMAAANGQSVACITATKGEAGVQDESRWPAAQLAQIRADELRDALEIIGVHHHHWLDYHDGQCQNADDKRAAEQVAEYIDLYQPDSILTFGPDGMTGHTDHRAVSKWVGEAVELARHTPKIYHAVQLRSIYEQYLKEADKDLDMFYNIDQPPLIEENNCDLCINLSDEVCQRKCQALAAQRSQTEQLMRYFTPDDLMRIYARETFVQAK